MTNEPTAAHGDPVQYTISIAVLNNLDLTKKCLDCLEKTTVGTWELIVSDNGSTDGTPEFLRQYLLTNPRCRVVTYPRNTGFGYPHDQALTIARGEFFVVLNNDIFIHEKGWNERMAREFGRIPRLALVGFAGNHSGISPDDLTGYRNPPVDEYVEASCLMIPRRLALTHGLFSPEYELAYYEDTDLSLRFRQMGYRFSLIPCDHTHVNNATALTLDPSLLRRAMVINRETFVNRWGGYLTKRSFSGAVLVRAVGSLEEILLTTPVIDALVRSHPEVRFTLETSHPELFGGWDLSVITTSPPEGEEFDRTVDFDYQSLPDDLPPQLGLALQAGILISTTRPVIRFGSPPAPAIAEWKGRLLVESGLLGEYPPLSRELTASGTGFVTVERSGELFRLAPHDGGEPVEVPLAALPSILSLMRGVVCREGILSLVASGVSAPQLLFLSPAHDPVTAGIDPDPCWFVPHPWPEREFVRMFGAFTANDLNRTIAVVHSSHLRDLFRRTQIFRYHATADMEKEYRAMIDEAREQTLRAHTDLAALHESLSWRVTAPLRKIHSLLTGWKGGTR